MYDVPIMRYVVAPLIKPFKQYGISYSIGILLLYQCRTATRRIGRENVLFRALSRTVINA